QTDHSHTVILTASATSKPEPTIRNNLRSVQPIRWITKTTTITNGTVVTARILVRRIRSGVGGLLPLSLQAEARSRNGTRSEIFSTVLRTLCSESSAR